jgi:D-3-phosphoglycerate dehydrogenase
MRVLVTDFTFENLDVERGIFEASGIELVEAQCRSSNDLMALVSDVDAVITQFAPVDATVIGAMKRAKVIVRYGIGVDNVDLLAAKNKEIPVCNVPDYCIHEVADHTMAFILALTRQVVVHSNRVHAEKWGLGVPVQSFRTLADMTVGVIGFGRIGKAVVKRLLAFESKVLVYDPVVDELEIIKAGAIPVIVNDIMTKSDCLTLHCPSTSKTRGMINKSSLKIAKRGMLLINLARGDLVEPDALVEALDSGIVGGAALDVFSPEPIPAGHPVLNRPNVILAPHIASVSEAAVNRLRTTVASLAVSALKGYPLASIVNSVSNPR